MPSVGIHKMAPLGVEDGVEAGDKHVGRDAGNQRLVDLGQYLTRRGRTQGPSCEPQHAAGGGHDQRCRYALACGVSYDHSWPTLREEVEVVEVSSHLPGWPVEGGDPPSFQGGHLLRQRGLLDASRNPKLLLYALPLAHLLL